MCIYIYLFNINVYTCYIIRCISLQRSPHMTFSDIRCLKAIHRGIRQQDVHRLRKGKRFLAKETAPGWDLHGFTLWL